MKNIQILKTLVATHILTALVGCGANSESNTLQAVVEVPSLSGSILGNYEGKYSKVLVKEKNGEMITATLEIMEQTQDVSCNLTKIEEQDFSVYRCYSEGNEDSSADLRFTTGAMAIYFYDGSLDDYTEGLFDLLEKKHEIMPNTETINLSILGNYEGRNSKVLVKEKNGEMITATLEMMGETQDVSCNLTKIEKQDFSVYRCYSEGNEDSSADLRFTTGAMAIYFYDGSLDDYTEGLFDLLEKK